MLMKRSLFDDFRYDNCMSPRRLMVIYHCYAAVQAVVMVSTILIGNGHFQTTINK